VSKTREEYNARKRREYAANREHHAARKQKWREDNPLKARAIALKFAHSEKGQKHRKRWRDEHPENVRATTERYRAKMTPERRKELSQKHRDNVQTKLKRGLKEAQKRDAEEGLDFDMALFDIILKNPPTHCACCSTELDYESRGRGCRNRSPSPDRVINAIGHTVGNTRYVCGRCNALKSDATPEESMMIAAYVQRHQQSLVKP
jgi:hypothetical protein